MSLAVENDARRIAGPAWASATAEAAIPVLASPSWRGVDSTLLRLRKPDGETCIAKIMDADCDAYSDWPTACKAAAQAAAAELGPAVLAVDVPARTLIMEDLSPAHGWTTGTLDRLKNGAVLQGVITAKKKFQALPLLGRKTNVFDHADALLEKCRAAKAPLPEDIAWLAASVHEARNAIRASGIDPVPAHGDGNISNVMISMEGAIRLVDFDMAGDMDPFEDLGSLLVEAHDNESDAVESFEAFHGRYDRSLFNRACLYGIADDLRWGLIGALLAGISPRVTHEFLKFGDWRLLRARMGIRDPRFSERLGRV
ncbi:phosphotransferase [soil metagenome]